MDKPNTGEAADLYRDELPDKGIIKIGKDNITSATEMGKPNTGNSARYPH